MIINKNSWHYKIMTMFGLSNGSNINHMTVIGYWLGVILSPIWYVFLAVVMIIGCLLYPVQVFIEKLQRVSGHSKHVKLTKYSIFGKIDVK